MIDSEMGGYSAPACGFAQRAGWLVPPASTHCALTEKVLNVSHSFKHQLERASACVIAQDRR